MKKESKEKIIPIIISISALLISIIMMFLQYKFSEAEYEYKRDPEMIMYTDMKTEEIAKDDGTHVTAPVITQFMVDIVEPNNIKHLYFISPDMEVCEIYLDKNPDGSKADIDAQIKDYFTNADENEKYLYTESGNTAYFYHFMVTTGIDDTMELELLFAKMYIDEEMLTSMRVDKVKIIEFEQAHKNDPAYEGERIIASKYREIEKYLKIQSHSSSL